MQHHDSSLFKQRYLPIYSLVLILLLGYFTHTLNRSSPPSALLQQIPIETAQQCPTPPFRFRAKGHSSNKVVQLSSYPGSGNTWVRHLIQRGTGMYTGSVYNDKSLKVEFPGETLRDEQVICVKSHYPCESCWFRGKNKDIPIERARSGAVAGYSATIQVLRNPFEALLSDFNHKKSGANHTGLASEEDLYSQVFVDFVLAKMKVWMDHAMHHLKENNGQGMWTDVNRLPVLLVYYDDLQQHTERELARMFAFLNQYSHDQVQDPIQGAKCAVQDLQGGFRRAKKPDDRKDPFEAIVDGDDKTLRQVACEYFQLQSDNTFWRRQWC